MKTCFVTKEVKPKTEMLRFVSSPDHVICFDVANKLPGRGFWLTTDRHILERAIVKKLFCKAAKRTVQIPDNLIDQVEKALRERCLNLLGLCRKAGLMVFGYEAVKKVVGQGMAVVAFEAADASEREQSKIYRPEDAIAVYALFNREELGRIAGLDETVHVALMAGRLSEEAADVAKKLNLIMGLC